MSDSSSPNGGSHFRHQDIDKTIIDNITMQCRRARIISELEKRIPSFKCNFTNTLFNNQIYVDTDIIILVNKNNTTLDVKGVCSVIFNNQSRNLHPQKIIHHTSDTQDISNVQIAGFNNDWYVHVAGMASYYLYLKNIGMCTDFISTLFTHNGVGADLLSDSQREIKSKLVDVLCDRLLRMIRVISPKVQMKNDQRELLIEDFKMFNSSSNNVPVVYVSPFVHIDIRYTNQLMLFLDGKQAYERFDMNYYRVAKAAMHYMNTKIGKPKAKPYKQYNIEKRTYSSKSITGSERKAKYDLVSNIKKRTLYVRRKAAFVKRNSNTNNPHIYITPLLHIVVNEVYNNSLVMRGEVIKFSFYEGPEHEEIMDMLEYLTRRKYPYNLRS